MAEETLVGVALAVLRIIRDWSQGELAAAAGIRPGSISDYERGKMKPSLKVVNRLLAAMGFPPSMLDRAIAFVQSGRARREGTLPAEPAGQIEEISVEAARIAGSFTRSFLTWLFRETEALEARRRAEELWLRLSPYTPEAQWALVQEPGPFQHWALLEKICAESERAAAKDPRRALELANLAVHLGEVVPGEDGWRLRLQGYALAHVGNAKRVGNDLAGAESAFARSDELWKAGASADPGLLDASRLLDLKASLRRDQRRLQEALNLLDEAFVLRRSDASAGRILLKKALTLEKLGEYGRALEALREAAPWVEAEREPRLLFGLKFNSLLSLCRLKRFGEAEMLRGTVRSLGLGLGNKLDLIRLRWLEATLDAGLGRMEEAVAAFDRVRQEFLDEAMPYDAALATLEHAVILAELHRTRDVKALAEQAVPVFQTLKVGREVLATLTLFHEAAKEERLTAEVARTLLEDLRKALNGDGC
ncbi:MAG: helix-turn-helix domain-containing protein [Thermoanaerobaculia bacterium]